MAYSLYTKNESGEIVAVTPGIDERVSNLETKAVETDLYKLDVREQTLTEEQKEQIRENIGITNVMSAIAQLQGDVSSKLPNSTPHIVDTWKSGKSWYRKWSDGWLEQGGYAQDAVSVTLPQPFSDTNYTLVGTTAVGTGEVRAASELATVRTPATFVMYYSAFSYSGHWYACGY